MKLMKMLVHRNADLYKNFIENSYTKEVEKKIIKKKVFTYHNYLFNSHRIYLVKNLLKHPVYRTQMIGFDLKYDPNEIVDLDQSSLFDVYKNKSFFRKIKINKQPTILDENYAKKISPYSEIGREELDLKIRQLETKEFLQNLEIVLIREAEEYVENKSQELPYEEETIYSKNLDFRDSNIMKNFHREGEEMGIC